MTEPRSVILQGTLDLMVRRRSRCCGSRRSWDARSWRTTSGRAPRLWRSSIGPCGRSVSARPWDWALGSPSRMGHSRFQAVSSQDGPGVMAAIAALILATGTIACGIPLRRALRIQPTEALRSEA